MAIEATGVENVMEEEGGCIALWEFEPIDSYIE